MKRASGMFSVPARALHWVMAIMIVAMLFIGIGMVASVSERHEWLLRIHEPLGIAIFALALVRLAVRLRQPPPPLPAELPLLQKLAAHASHWLLYALMLLLPLIGWAMLSAGGYPLMITESLRLPAILPVSPATFAVLRHLHTWLAMLLFATFLAHMAAALHHGLIRGDDVLSSMTVQRAAVLRLFTRPGRGCSRARDPRSRLRKHPPAA
jgi:cytochrome b561